MYKNGIAKYIFWSFHL